MVTKKEEKIIKKQPSILIELLQSLNNSELERFSKFLANTYFNTDQHILKLLKALRKHVLNKKPFNNILQAKIYQQIFSNTSCIGNQLNENQKKLLRAKMSILTKLTHRFLTIEALSENPACESELLNKKLLQKKQFRSLDRLYNRYKKQVEQNPIHGEDQYALSWQIEVSKMNNLYHQGTITKEDNFKEVVRSLDLWYLVNKLSLQFTVQSVINVTKKSYDFPPLATISSLINLPNYKKNPLITLYLTVLDLIEDPKKETFTNLLLLLEKNHSSINPIHLAGFYTTACNFCTHQIRAGQIQYKQDLLVLYKKIDQKNLLVENDILQIVKFGNIVGLSCQLKDFDWAIELINKYYSFIPKEVQKSVHYCMLAVVEFYKGDYKKAISQLIRVDKVNLNFDLAARVLLLKAHYQLDKEYDERTLQIFRSAERFVQTNQLMSTAYKIGYKNFIQILINLYRLRYQVGKQTLESIENKLQKMKFVSDKKWLLEKIEELK